MQAAQHLLIGKNEKYADDGSGTASTATTPYQLKEGSLGVYKYDSNGNPTLLSNGDTIQDAPNIVIAVGLGTDEEGNSLGAWISPEIEGRYALKWTGVSYTAPVKQTTFIGYNETDGSIRENNDETYDLELVDDSGGSSIALDLRENFIAEGDPAIAALDVAKVTAKRINEGTYYNTRGSRIAQADAVADATTTHDMDNTVSIEKGSNELTVSTNLQYGANTGSLTKGDLIRIDESGGGSTSTTDPVFEITDINSLTVTLDRNYYGTALSSAAAGNVTYFSGNSNEGIKLKSLNFDQHFKVGTSKSGYGKTEVRTATTFKPGSGRPVQVAKLEEFTSAFAGKHDYENTYAITPDSKVDNSATYDLYKLVFREVHESKVNIGFEGQDLTLFIVAPAAFTGQSTFEGRLNRYFASNPANFASISL